MPIRSAVAAMTAGRSLDMVETVETFRGYRSNAKSYALLVDLSSTVEF